MLFNFPGLGRFLWLWLFRSRWTFRRLAVAIAFVIVFPLLELFVWVGLWWDEIFFRGYRKKAVRQPVFIVGNPRSGTTFLHRLLAKDAGRFETMKMWEILFAPSILQRKMFTAIAALERALGRPIHRLQKRLEKRWHQLNVMHEVSFSEPEEDDYLLLHVWSALTIGLSSGLLPLAMPYTYFDSGLPTPRRQRLMVFYRRCVQRHLYANRSGDRAYLAKNPALCPKLGSVFETFPDARIVYLVRSPLEMLPSYLSMMEFSWRAVGRPIDGPELRDYLIEMAGHWYRYPLEILEQAPENQTIVLRYDDLVSNPQQAVERIYETFGLNIDEDYAQILAEETDRARDYRSRHAYSGDRMGLSRQRILDEFGDLFERFDFDTGKDANLND